LPSSATSPPILHEDRRGDEDGGGGEPTILDVEAFPPCRQWYAVHRKGKRLSRAAQTFLDYLQNEGEAEVAHLLTDVAVNSVEVG